MKVEESRTPGSDENERGSEKDVKEEDEEVAPDAEDRAQAMRSATASSKMTGICIHTLYAYEAGIQV